MVLDGIRSRFTTSTPDSTAGVDVDIDDVFDVLANQRRRLVIHYLARDVPDASLRDLSEYIAAVENDVPAEDLSSQERKRVYIGLHQCHLDKLADAGVLEYDEQSQIVSATEETRALADAIDHVETTVAGGDR